MMKKFSAVLILTLMLVLSMTSVIYANSITASVNGQSGPWNVSLNPSYYYGSEVGGGPNVMLEPTVVATGLNMTPGGTLTIAWISGNVCGGAGGTAWTDGANGDADWGVCYSPSNCSPNPSYYIPADEFPVTFMELIGVFANSEGVIVGSPFVIGNGPKTVTIPTGASRLQLGFDDSWFNDNSADLQVCVSDTASGCGISPMAEAGPDQFIDQTTDAEAEVVLDGSASTDDGMPQPLTYTWSWDGGSATGVSPTVTLPLGTTQVTLTVFDGRWYDNDTVNITVRNTSHPVANAGPDQFIDQTSEAGAEVVLDGSASTDDGLPQPLTYTWSWDGGSADGVSPTVTLPLGTTQVTLTVFDGQWYDQDTVNIMLRDAITPLIWCKEGVNPSGKNVPKSKNPDGFYQIFTSDVGGSAPQFWVGTADNPMLFGPAWSGIYIKLTEAPGVEPSYKLIGNMNNILIYHVFLPSDAVFTAVDSSGNTSTCKCLVPPPPK